MNNEKHTLQDFLIIILIFSAIYLFVTVGLYHMADRSVDNENHEIEDTGYYVRYTSLIPSGIYDGLRTDSKLMLEGSFGYDWGAAVEGDQLYCNEYRNTTLGFMTCDVVRISLETFQKEVILRDAMLRGRCRSGQLVCFEGILPGNWFADTNPLAHLYSLSSGKGLQRGNAAIVRLIDPENGQTVFMEEASDALTDEGEARYLEMERR